MDKNYTYKPGDAFPFQYKYEHMGVTTDLNEDEAGATLTLGVQNVTPLELANCLATIANGGTRHDLCAISVIEDKDGNVIVDDSDASKRAKRVLRHVQNECSKMCMRPNNPHKFEECESDFFSYLYFFL